MQFQSALRKSPRQIIYQRLGLRLAATVADSIVGVPFKRYVPMLTLHPHVEDVVQEQVCQQRTNRPANKSAKLFFDITVSISRKQLRPAYGQAFRTTWQSG
jgi:hypothetical protein